MAIVHDLQQKEAFVLKGSLQTLTTMHLQRNDLKATVSNLDYLISQTPHFFQNLPVILDLETLANEADILDFNPLLAALKARSLVIVGVRGGNETQTAAAVEAGLGVLPARKKTPNPEDQALTQGNGNRKPQAKTAPTASKTITHPVRSGQQVHAKRGDLIIINTVSEGAEVLADGNIHIYGTLRGRALAGLGGDTNARIFCRKLQAELVAIAGHYLTNEQLKLPPTSHGYQLFLKDDALQIEAL